VLELTRIGIENRNLKMRLESLSSRMDFDERRARALEGVVQYRPGTGPARDPAQQQARPQPLSLTPPAVQQVVDTAEGAALTEPSTGGAEGTESSTARRRRRRRRGRRGGRSRAPEAAASGAEAALSPEDSPTPPHGDPTGEAALDAAGGSDSGREGDSDSESGDDDEGPDPSAQ
jgi:hypothetical protein